MSSKNDLISNTLNRSNACAAVILVAFFMPWISASVLSITGTGGSFGISEVIDNLSMVAIAGSKRGEAAPPTWMLNLVYVIPMMAGWYLYKSCTGRKRLLNVLGLFLGLIAVSLVLIVKLLLNEMSSGLFSFAHPSLGSGAIVFGIASGILVLLSLGGMLHSTRKGIGGLTSGENAKNPDELSGSAEKNEYVESVLTKMNAAAESAKEVVSKIAAQDSAESSPKTKELLFAWAKQNQGVALGACIGLAVFAVYFTKPFIVFALVCAAVIYLSKSKNSGMEAKSDMNPTDSDSQSVEDKPTVEVENNSQENLSA